MGGALPRGGAPVRARPGIVPGGGGLGAEDPHFLSSREFQRLRGAALEAGGDPELAGREGSAPTCPWGPGRVKESSG